MKKLLAILAFSASTAVAGPTVELSHTRDYGSETKVSVAQSFGRIGTVDAGLVTTRYQKQGVFSAFGMDNANGFDLGYSNGLSLGPVGVTGRLGYGRLNGIDQNGGGFTSNTSYFSLGAEAQVPVMSSVNAFVNYRHRNAIGDGPNQHRVQLGAEVAVTKSIGARLGMSHARQAGDSGTGINAALNYTF